MLGGEGGHRYQPVDVPGLSCLECAALQTTHADRLSSQHDGRLALALPGMRDAILFAPRPLAGFVLCPLRHLRESGVAAHRPGVCPRP